MKNVFRNAFAILRGGFICAWNFLFRKCKYENPVRVFRGADITVDKGGKLLLGKGVAIGARSQCTVRRGATLKLGAMSSLNSDCKLVCREKIEIGENTIFGPNVLVYDHDHLFDAETGVKRKEYKTGEVVIGKNCWIGANTVILRGTRIGDNSVVGAGSVVKGEYPAGSKIVQKRPENSLGGV